MYGDPADLQCSYGILDETEIMLIGLLGTSFKSTGSKLTLFTKSIRRANVCPFQCNEMIRLLACLLPSSAHGIFGRLISSDNCASERGENGWQWLMPNTKAQTDSTLVKKSALLQGLTNKEEFRVLPVQSWLSPRPNSSIGNRPVQNQLVYTIPIASEEQSADVEEASICR
jgi:hypothetical protein